ncbi:MAG TPA: hypothetical protein PKO07_24905 [Pseudomonadota bacterium]|nr:hypothetical protein [Pseudomonadota bacterium]
MTMSDASIPDMAMTDMNGPASCTKSNTNEQILKFPDIKTQHTIHAISRIDGAAKSITAFNLVDEKGKNFHIISYDVNDPCSARSFGPYGLPSSDLRLQGISASADGFSFDANFMESQRRHYDITLDLTITGPDLRTYQAWSMNSGSNGTLHVIEVGNSSSQWPSVSTNRDFSMLNLAPKQLNDISSLSTVVVGKLASGDGVIAWGKDANSIYSAKLGGTNNLLKTTSYPEINGCQASVLQLCSVALGDIVGAAIDELVVARPNGIMIYKDGSSANTIFIPTETEPQAVSVSINTNRTNRKLVWASSIFDTTENTNVITIHTIPVSSLM